MGNPRALGINKIDKVFVPSFLSFVILERLVIHLIIERDTSRLNYDATVSFILTGKDIFFTQCHPELHGRHRLNILIMLAK